VVVGWLSITILIELSFTAQETFAPILNIGPYAVVVAAGHAVAKASGENPAIENPATAAAPSTAYFARILPVPSF
jgi:hypothetical protein